MYYKHWLAALGAAALLSACGKGGMVSGKVVLQGSDDASGVAVSLLGEGRQTNVVTGADGAFAFDGLGDGVYQLAFDASDITEHHKTMAVKLEKGGGGVTPDVALTAAGTVHGKVTAGADTGNSGIQVAVAGTQLFAVTADDGSYTLEGVPAGARTLIATRGGYIATQALTVARGTQDVAPFVLGKQAQRSGTVIGSVAFYDGATPTRATLSVPELGVSVTPGADGRFSLTLPEGEWDVMSEAPNYPRQVLAHVRVTADAQQDIGPRHISAYYRFHPSEPTQTWMEGRIFDDGRHALVSRSGWENMTHSLVDLETGEERIVLIEWNWNYPTDWVANRDGSALVYVTGASTYNQTEGWRSYSDYQLHNTTSGARFMSRGAQNTSSDWSLSAFSSDGSVFFGVDQPGAGAALHRMSASTGETVKVPADLRTQRADADHYLAFARGPVGEVVGSVTRVTPTEVTPLLTDVFADTNRMGSFGRYAVVLTGCNVGSTGACTAKVIDGVTGQVKTVTGASFSTSSCFSSTDHPNWAYAACDGSASGYLKLSDATFTAFPSGYTHAASAKIEPSGGRIVYTTSTSTNGVTTYSLFMAGMPVQAVPSTPVDSGSGQYTYRWLSTGNLVATNNVATSGTVRLIRRVNDTTVDDTDVVPGSLSFGTDSVVWTRQSDKAVLALHRGSAPFVLAPGNAGGTYRLMQRQYYTGWPEYTWKWAPVVVTTKDGTWTTWTVENTADATRTLVARRASDGKVQTFPNTAAYLDGESYGHDRQLFPSQNGLLVYTTAFDYQDELLDLATGVRRQVWEVDVDDVWSGGREATSPGVAHGFMNASFVTDRTTDGDTVYELGLMKY